MSVRLGARLVAVVLPAALLLPATAHAEKVVTRDAAGDVVSATTDLFTLDTGEEISPAPDNRRADIIRTVVDHRAGLLQVAVTFRDVRDNFDDNLLARIRTPTGSFVIFADRKGRESYTLMIGRRDFVTCGGLLTTVDRATDQVSVAVPTACIGDPRWVQVGIAATGRTVQHDVQVGDRLHAFVDDAHAGPLDDSRPNPVLGPKVHRGRPLTG